MDVQKAMLEKVSRMGDLINVMIVFHIPATEIQNIQIGDGDIPHNIPIPIYMIFPRLFTCPTLITTNFKIGKYQSLINFIIFLMIQACLRGSGCVQEQMDP